MNDEYQFLRVGVCVCAQSPPFSPHFQPPWMHSFIHYYAYDMIWYAPENLKKKVSLAACCCAWERKERELVEIKGFQREVARKKHASFWIELCAESTVGKLCAELASVSHLPIICALRDLCSSCMCKWVCMWYVRFQDSRFTVFMWNVLQFSFNSLHST